MFTKTHPDVSQRPSQPVNGKGQAPPPLGISSGGIGCSSWTVMKGRGATGGMARSKEEEEQRQRERGLRKGKRRKEEKREGRRRGCEWKSERRMEGRKDKKKEGKGGEHPNGNAGSCWWSWKHLETSRAHILFGPCEGLLLQVSVSV